MRLFYSDDYVRAKHGFDTTRKSQWIAESLNKEPIRAITVVAPRAVTAEELGEIHDPHYVQAMLTGTPRRLAESQNFPWDPELFHAACASTGGAVEAARAALVDGVSGSLSSGLHHAARTRGKGNCTFNGLALAALSAQRAGARSVLVLDVDAHCGGGTHSLLRGIPGIRHVDMSTNVYDLYVPQTGNSLRLIVRPRKYLATLEKLLRKLEDEPPFDLCIYNAGMDPHEGCDHGGLSGITSEILRERERLVFRWCRQRSIPVAFVIAGGYIGKRLTKEDLVALHRFTLAEAVSQM